MVAHRNQSVPATCERDVGHAVDAEGTVRVFRCRAPMHLAVHRSAISSEPWELLIVECCLVGHYAHIQGVELSPETA